MYRSSTAPATGQDAKKAARPKPTAKSKRRKGVGAGIAWTRGGTRRNGVDLESKGVRRVEGKQIAKGLGLYMTRLQTFYFVIYDRLQD